MKASQAGKGNFVPKEGPVHKTRDKEDYAGDRFFTHECEEARERLLKNPLGAPNKGFIVSNKWTGEVCYAYRKSQANWCLERDNRVITHVPVEEFEKDWRLI